MQLFVKSETPVLKFIHPKHIIKVYFIYKQSMTTLYTLCLFYFRYVHSFWAHNNTSPSSKYNTRWIDTYKCTSKRLLFFSNCCFTDFNSSEAITYI